MKNEIVDKIKQKNNEKNMK